MRPADSHGISTVDTVLLGRTGLCAAYLLREQDRAAIIDCGTALAAPRLMAALQQQGLQPEQVDWLIVTHIHLDHAGAAGALMQQLPNARLVVHPRGSAHMIDPGKLIAGATAVYGEQKMLADFGLPVPIDPERVIEAADEQTIDLNGRPLQLLDTPGHASHHICIVDPRSGGIFSGDTFGLSYPALDSPAGPFIYPTTTPVQFDPQQLHHSIDRLMAQGPKRFHLTHYGTVSASIRLSDDLHRHIDTLVDIAKAQEFRLPAGDSREKKLRSEIRAAAEQAIRQHGCTLDTAAIDAVLGMDVALNSQGLEVWLQRRARRREDKR